MPSKTCPKCWSNTYLKEWRGKLRCFRCEMTFEGDRIKTKVSTPLPWKYAPFDLTSLRFAVEQKIVEIPASWSIDVETLIAHGAQAAYHHFRGPAIYLPYRAGAQLRFLDGELPKVHSIGHEKAWMALLPHDPPRADTLAIAEGWADGIVLQGEERTVRVIAGPTPTDSMLKELEYWNYKRIILGLDRDDAGVLGTKTIARHLLSRWVNREHELYALPLPAGIKDPGKAGTQRVREAISYGLHPIRNLRQLYSYCANV